MIPHLKLKSTNIFRHKKLLCQNLSLDFYAGQSWAILGKNGIGKTTLLHTLAGLHHEFSGEIELKQKPIQKLSRIKVAKKLAILLQTYEDIFPQSVFDTVLMSRFPHLNFFKNESPIDLEIVDNALKKMEVHHLKHTLINEISGGERRRVAAAQVIAQDPDIFLLDEPLHQLDLKYQSHVLNYFKLLCHLHHKTVIMSMHDINMANRFCDHIIMLFDNGEYLAGKKQEIFTKKNLEKLFQQKLFCIESEAGKYWVGS